MNATLAAEELSAEQKEHLHEVAHLVLQIYQTLVDMRYVSPEALVEGPHEFSEELLATYERCELAASVIYLYSIMPYIDEVETEARDFFQGSSFFNPLRESDVVRGRDPRYLSPEGGFDDENGKYMYPWYTPLSNCANHSSMLIYDTQRHVIWMVEQIGGDTTDPVYCEWYGETRSAKEESCWGDSDSSVWAADSDGPQDDAVLGDNCHSGGSSEFWSDGEDTIDRQEVEGMIADQAEAMDYDEGFEQIEPPEAWELHEAALKALDNKNSLEAIRNRPAGDALCDINRWYRELKELPGQGEHNIWLGAVILKALYLKNGWAGDFDGEGFEVDYARAYAAERARYDAEEPLRKVQCYESWIEAADRDVKQCKQYIAEAITLDDEWNARFKLWKAEERTERNARDLRDAKEEAEKMCPGGVCQKAQDLPLWELEKLRVETQWKRASVQRSSAPVPSGKSNAESIRRAKAQHRQAQHKLQVFEKAFCAAKADAEHLCPGMTFKDATGIKSLGQSDTLTQVASQEKLVVYYENYVQAISNFADTVPHDALSAAAKVKEEIKELEKTLRRVRGDLAKLRDTMA